MAAAVCARTALKLIAEVSTGGAAALCPRDAFVTTGSTQNGAASPSGAPPRMCRALLVGAAPRFLGPRSLRVKVNAADPTRASMTCTRPPSLTETAPRPGSTASSGAHEHGGTVDSTVPGSVDSTRSMRVAMDMYPVRTVPPPSDPPAASPSSVPPKVTWPEWRPIAAVHVEPIVSEGAARATGDAGRAKIGSLAVASRSPSPADMRHCATSYPLFGCSAARADSAPAGNGAEVPVLRRVRPGSGPHRECCRTPTSSRRERMPRQR